MIIDVHTHSPTHQNELPAAEKIEAIIRADALEALSLEDPRKVS